MLSRPVSASVAHFEHKTVAAPMAAQEPVKRPRLSAWKVLAVLSLLVLLTPVWIAYGCLGALLTLPSRTIAKTGLHFLAVLGLWLLFQVFLTDVEGEQTTNGQSWRWRDGLLRCC